MATQNTRTNNTHHTGNTSNTETPVDDDHSSSIDNNSHPLYLHNNDQPGTILISKKLLGSENYSTWK